MKRLLILSILLISGCTNEYGHNWQGTMPDADFQCYERCLAQPVTGQAGSCGEGRKFRFSQYRHGHCMCSVTPIYEVNQ